MRSRSPNGASWPLLRLAAVYPNWRGTFAPERLGAPRAAIHCWTDGRHNWFGRYRSSVSGAAEAFRHAVVGCQTSSHHWAG